jgi:hypothetical protein
VTTATQPFFNDAVKQIRFAQVTDLDEQLLIGRHSSAPKSSIRLYESAINIVDLVCGVCKTET